MRASASSASCRPPALGTAAGRLKDRERGPELEESLRSSTRKARLLEEHAPADTVRITTDGRSVGDLAREVVGVTGWAR